MILRGNGGLLAGPAPSFRLYGTAAGPFQTIIPAGPAGITFAFAMKATRLEGVADWRAFPLHRSR